MPAPDDDDLPESVKSLVDSSRELIAKLDKLISRLDVEKCDDAETSLLSEPAQGSA